MLAKSCLFLVCLTLLASSPAYASNSSSCSLSTGTESIAINGNNRDYQVYIPAGIVYPSAVVFVWHGIDSSPDDIEKKMKLQPQSDAEKFILVYPRTKNYKSASLLSPAAFNGAACCKDDQSFDEVSLFKEIRLKLFNDGCVDDSHGVFSMGYSNGGFATHRVACEQPGLLSAISIHSGSHGDYNGNYDNSPWKTCPTTNPVPTLGFHGNNDKIVPFNGGSNPIPWSKSKWGSFAQTMEVWGNQNSCTGSSSTTFTEGGDTVIKTTFQDCDVEGYVIEGMGHEWWQGSTSRIISFFKNYGL